MIGQRGWVFVGDFATEGEQIVLSNAKCVRKWGTTKGLGQLALAGPTKDTVLDECGTVRMHQLAAVGTIDCKPEVWSA